MQEVRNIIKEIFDIVELNHITSGKYSISSYGGCWKKKYLEMKGLYKEKFNASTIRSFSIGDIFHRQAVKELIEKGDKNNIHVVASEVNIREHSLISGRADLIISIAKTGELIVVDVKSASDYTLTNLHNEKVEKYIDNYISQMQLYLHFFNLKRGFILFFGKHRGKIDEIEVIYSKEKAEKIIEEIEDFFIKYINMNIEPANCDGGQFGCECCGVKKLWS